MIISGFIELVPGIWYEESTGLPWTTRKQIKSKNKYGGFITNFESQLKRIYSKDKKGYYQIISFNKCYKFHRLVYEHFNGTINNGMVIDHINGNSYDNRIDNLQCITNQQNIRKQRICKKNKTGFAGVSFNKTKNCYVSCIGLSTKNNRKTKNLGCFNSPEDAYQAYLTAKIKYHGKESISLLEEQYE